MSIGDHARIAPARAALIGGATGRVTSYRDLFERSCRLANALRTSGRGEGDAVGLLMENHARVFEIAWGAADAGARVVTADRALALADIAAVFSDARVSALIASSAAAQPLPPAALITGVPDCKAFWMSGGAAAGWESYEAKVAGQSTAPVTGAGSSEPPMTGWLRDAGFNADSVFLSTASLSGELPLRAAMAAQWLGGTVVLMEAFDARESLRLIERYRVTHGVWMPTMLESLLELPQPIRASYDMTSLRCAIDAGTPGRTQTTQAMLEWWGPVLREFRAGIPEAAA